jgi:hypothetical protein
MSANDGISVDVTEFLLERIKFSPLAKKFFAF